MPLQMLPALRRRGEPAWPDGTLIVTTDGIARYVVRNGRYSRLDSAPVVD